MHRILPVFVLLALLPAAAGAARLKDLAMTKGVRDNQLVGYGLVVGLNGTGDGSKAAFTTQGLANMMEQLGVHVRPQDLKVKNVAGVMITAKLPPFVKVGQTVDVLVSSLGDATSLQGGTLLATTMKGLDGQVYAVAQGPLAVGGFAVGGGGGAAVQKNHPTVARIPGGATVEREVPLALAGRSELVLSLASPDFTTMSRAVQAVNRQLAGDFARAEDGATLRIRVPEAYAGDIVGLLAAVESVEVVPDMPARVVLDERTGTVVMGENVRIGRVAVSHGNLSLEIRTGAQVSQPAPLGAGETVVVPATDIAVAEEPDRLVVLDGGPTITEVVRALNAVGVNPRDLIAIFHAIKAAGALQADLSII
ncbi:MAG: flagellar basal body P-ring protein FlgI [Thermodesulfobacteriota bacterium]